MSTQQDNIIDQLFQQCRNCSDCSNCDDQSESREHIIIDEVEYQIGYKYDYFITFDIDKRYTNKINFKIREKEISEDDIDTYPDKYYIWAYTNGSMDYVMYEILHMEKTRRLYNKIMSLNVNEGDIDDIKCIQKKRNQFFYITPHKSYMDIFDYIKPNILCLTQWGEGDGDEYKVFSIRKNDI